MIDSFLDCPAPLLWRERNEILVLRW